MFLVPAVGGVQQSGRQLPDLAARHPLQPAGNPPARVPLSGTLTRSTETLIPEVNHVLIMLGDRVSP